jgi:hypothetical protein
MQSCTGKRLARHVRVEQAVVGVGQHAVVIEGGDAAPRQDGRQTRVLAEHKAPAQRFAHQTVDGQRAQAVLFQP